MIRLKDKRSQGENFGKLNIKDSAKLANKQKDNLNFDIGRRILEEDVIDQASNNYFQNKGIGHQNVVKRQTLH